MTFLNYKYCFEIQINMWIFDILFLCLFSYLIIQMDIYRHHYFSIILIILAGIGLNIIISLKYFHLIKTKIINIIIKFINEIGCSLLYVIVKYTMEKKFCSPFEMCFYQGFICLILYLLFIPINIFFFSLDKLEGFKKDFRLQNLYFIIFFIIIQFGYNIFFFITIKNCTTCHIMIIIIIGEISHYIMDKDELGITNFIIIICLLIFILFMQLIFNEILEVNCCEMQKNTKKNITARAKIDTIIDLYEDDDEADEEKGKITIEKEDLNGKDEEKKVDEENDKLEELIN